MTTEERVKKINQIQSELIKLKSFEFEIRIKLERGSLYGRFFIGKTTLFFTSFNGLGTKKEIEIPKQIEIKILAETITWIKELEKQLEQI